MKKLILGLVILFGSSAYAEVTCHLAEEGKPSEEIPKTGNTFQTTFKNYSFTGYHRTKTNGDQHIHYIVENENEGLSLSGGGLVDASRDVEVHFNIDVDKTGSKKDVNLYFSCWEKP